MKPGETMNLLSLKTRQTRSFVSKRDIATVLVGAFGFFVGRAVVFTFVNPLAIPFLATFMGSKGAFYWTAIFLTLGLATRIGELLTLRYMLAIGLLCIYYFFGTKIASKYVDNTARMSTGWLRLPYIAGAAAVSMLLSGLGFALIYGVSTFLIMVALIETILAGSLTLIVKRAHIILTARRRRSNLLSGEDIIALTVVLAGVIAGASEIYVGAMPLRFFFCVYVLCIVAFKGGPSMAAAAGLLLGIFLHLAGHWDTGLAAVLGLAGMGGGFGKRFGRGGVLAGVAVLGAATLAIIAPSMLAFSLIYALIAAGVAFFLTPQSFYFNVASAITPVLDSADDYMDKIKEETTRRLDKFSAAFEKLAETFSGLSKPKHSLNKHDITLLIDDLANRACNGCPHFVRCWEDDLYLTHQYVFNILNICSQKEDVSHVDIDPGFLTSCRDPEKVLRELSGIFTLYKNNLRWHNRIAESRELVSQQLQGVAGIVKGLSDEIDMSLKFHEGLEEEMIMALLKQKIEVNSVIVLENQAGRYRVTVNHRPCGHDRACTKEILPVLSTVLKRRMRLEQSDCDIRKNVCSARFVEDQKLRITTGVAHRAKTSKGSGDSYSFMDLTDGTCLLVLSDGMGSGERARRESAATVDLLEDFIESGFNKDLAVRMINSVLVLKSSEESFSTLDICSIDLYNGETEFIKIGAAATFILRDGKVKVIRSSSLPIGMLNDVDLEVHAGQLEHDDIIIMVTDGITEAVAQGAAPIAKDEDWLTFTIKQCKSSNPQDMADYVLNEAEELVGLPKDDMTVLVARVWEKL
ncbi:MAG: stage II sporulation protein E [Defluviitaleaceae bacterium]|nr:stage II sporulation protein E [Defluviitaleaceae bacterium]